MSYAGMCRFCKKEVDHRSVKYATRHYAHYHCYLDAGKKLADLTVWQRQQFPYFLLKERGLLDQVGDEPDATILAAG